MINQNTRHLLKWTLSKYLVFYVSRVGVLFTLSNTAYLYLLTISRQAKSPFSTARSKSSAVAMFVASGMP